MFLVWSSWVFRYFCCAITKWYHPSLFCSVRSFCFLFFHLSFFEAIKGDCRSVQPTLAGMCWILSLGRTKGFRGGGFQTNGWTGNISLQWNVGSFEMGGGGFTIQWNLFKNWNLSRTCTKDQIAPNEKIFNSNIFNYQIYFPPTKNIW